MDDPYLEKLGRLVRRVYEKTRDGSIEWSPHNSDEQTFVSEIGGLSTTIALIDYLSEDGDPVRDVEIAIFNDDGRKIEAVRDGQLWQVDMHVDGFSGWFALMNSIFEAAKRQANGSEAAVNKLLEALEDEPS